MLLQVFVQEKEACISSGASGAFTLRQSHYRMRWWKATSYWAHPINDSTQPPKQHPSRPNGDQFPLPQRPVTPPPRKGTCHFRLSDGQLKESSAVCVWGGGCGHPIKWIRLMSYLYGWRLPWVGKVRRLYSAALWSCAENHPIYTLSQATIMRVTLVHVYDWKLLEQTSHSETNIKSHFL